MARPSRPTGGYWKDGEDAVGAVPFFPGLNDREGIVFDQIEDAMDYAEELVGGAPSTVFGNDSIGATTQPLNINHSVVIVDTFPSPGFITLEAYVEGDGIDTGSVSLRGVVYDGVDTDSARVSQGTPISVATDDPPGWVLLGENLAVNAGDQAFGFQVGNSNAIGVLYIDTGASGSSYFNNDTYSDGAAAAFGVATASTAIPSIRATFTPNPPAAIGGLTVQNQGVQVGAQQAATTLNVMGATVTLTLASGVATITVGSDAPATTTTTYVLGNYPLPADAVVESDPLTATTVTANAVGDQNFDSLLVQDSLDASTWRTRATGGAAAAAMNATGVSSWTYMRAVLTNDSVAQGDFQLDLSVTT